MIEPGSPPGTLNVHDWRNTGKHLLIVAAAAGIAALAQAVAPALEAVGLSGLTVIVTTLLTLLSRYLQDNRV